MKEDGVTAGMEDMEDNHEEEFYRFMQDQNKRKLERERQRMLTYEERGPTDDVYAAEEHNAQMQMQDFDGGFVDYPEGDFEGDFDSLASQQKRAKPAKQDSEPEQLSIAEQMRRQQLQHWQGQLKTQVGAQSEFKAKIKEPGSMQPPQPHPPAISSNK